MEGFVIRSPTIYARQSLRQIIGAGQIFGQQSLIMNTYTTEFYTSRDYTICESLSRQDFLAAADQIPNSYSKILQGLDYN